MVTRWLDPKTFDLVTRYANGKVTQSSDPKKIAKHIKEFGNGI